MRGFWKQMNVRNRLNIKKSETSIMESLFSCIFVNQVLCILYKMQYMGLAEIDKKQKMHKQGIDKITPWQ